MISAVIDGEAFEFEKDFAHITVWKAAGVQAVEANELSAAQNVQVTALAAPISLAAVVRMA